MKTPSDTSSWKLLGPGYGLLTETDMPQLDVPLPFHKLQLVKSLVFHTDLKPKKDTPFGRSLPM